MICKQATRDQVDIVLAGRLLILVNRYSTAIGEDYDEGMDRNIWPRYVVVSNILFLDWDDARSEENIQVGRADRKMTTGHLVSFKLWCCDDKMYFLGGLIAGIMGGWVKRVL